MKTTVYAVRDQNKTRVSCRYRDIETAREVKGDLERHGVIGLEVYRTTQSLPLLNRRISWVKY